MLVASPCFELVVSTRTTQKLEEMSFLSRYVLPAVFQASRVQQLPSTVHPYNINCFDITRHRDLTFQPSDGDASSEDAPIDSSAKTLQREPPLQDSEDKRSGKTAARLERGRSRSMSSRGRRKRTHSVSDSIEKEHGDAFYYQSSEDFTDLPSPFSVHAVRLDLQDQFVWSTRRFGVAFWARLNSASHSVGCDLSPDGPMAQRDGFCPEVDVACEEILHLVSLGSGKNWIEIWLTPSCSTFTFRFSSICLGNAF